MADFDGSPRSSKRRKTSQYQSEKTPPSPGVLHNFAAGISKKLFGTTSASNKSSAPTANDNSVSLAGTAYKPKDDTTNGTPNGNITLVPDVLNPTDDIMKVSNEASANGVAIETPTRKRREQRNTSKAAPASIAEHPNPGKQPPGSQLGQQLHREGTPAEENTQTRLNEEEADQVERGDDNLGDQDAESTPVKTRSSGRERKKPRRFSNDMAESVKAKQPLGIMTPSGKKRGPKKAVAFKKQHKADPTHLDHELNFEDVSNPKQRKGAGRSSVKLHQDMSEDRREDLRDEASDDLTEEILVRSLPTLVEDTDIFVDAQVTDAGTMNVDVPDYATEFYDYCQNRGITELEPLRNTVLDQLTAKRRLKLVGLEEEYQKVHQLLEHTVVAGEGNSMLILGSRGCGKTTLVENIISDLTKDHAEEFHVVRLNGFLQSDDRLALREIWRQLGRELDEDEDANQTISYADTMASLLALLAHPEELLSAETGSTARSIIFVMDEFDLFASHPRQTLLYNLFDIAQARKAPIAVIGLTTKVDVTEHLEKRVKSRFSHRYIHLPLSKSFSAFSEICKRALVVERIDSAEVDARLLEQWCHYVEVRICRSTNRRRACARPAKNLQHLFEDEVLTETLRQIYYRTKSVPDLLAACLPCIAEMSLESIPVASSFAQGSLAAPESKLHLLPGLSDLELSLLIAAARLDVILGTDTCNFNMVYHEYQSIASRAKIQSSASGTLALGAGSKIWNRELSLGAWERLGEAELIIPAIGSAVSAGGTGGAGGGAGIRDVSREGRMFRVDVALEEILPSVHSMSSAMAKWCKEI